MLVNSGKWIHLHPDQGAGGAGTGTGGTTPPAGGTGGGADNGNGAGGGVTFTPEQQAVIDRIVGERAKRAEASAVTTLLQTLGVKDPEEIKARLAKLGELEGAKLSEAEKAKAQQAKLAADLEAAKKRTAEAEERAARALMRQAVEREAVRAGFAADAQADVWTFVQADPKLREAVKLGADGETVEGVEDAVKAVATARPRWLDKAGTQQAPPPRLDATSRGGGSHATTKEDLDEYEKKYLRR